MEGLFWSLGLWTALILLVLPATGHLPGRFSLPSREQLALIVLLIGTTSTVARSAEEVLGNPLVGESILRGILATTALLLVTPLLISRLQRLADVRFRALMSLTFYGLVAVASILYSVAPFSTAGKAYELVVAIAIGWTIASNPERRRLTRQTIEILILFGALQVGLAVIGFFAAPNLFAEVQSRTPFIGTATMVSPYSHSNGLSAEGALVSAYALARWFTIRRERTDAGPSAVLWQVIFVIGTVGTVLASARQGLVIWLASVAVVLWIFRRSLLAFVVPLMTWVAIDNWDVVWQSISRSQRAHTLETWSGRLLYWQSALEAWGEHPFTGFGFGAGGRFVALLRLDKTTISSVHSGYVEALMGVGLIGLVPLAYVIWRVVRWSLRELSRRVDAAPAVLIVPLLLHTSVSLGFGAWVQPSVVLFMLLVVLSDIDVISVQLEHPGIPSHIGAASSPLSVGRRGPEQSSPK